MFYNYLTDEADHRHANRRETPAGWDARNITIGWAAQQEKISRERYSRMQKNPPDPGPGGISCNRAQIIRCR